MRGLVLLGVLVSSGCVYTRVVDSWVDPQIEHAEIGKVAAVAMMPEEATRRAAEDEMVAELRSRGIEATPGYEIFGGAAPTEAVVLRDQLEGKFDGVMTLRFVGQTERLDYVSGGYYGFYGWYDWYAPYAYDPGYFDVETVVQMETNLYSLDEDKLLFTTTSQTIDPSSARQMTGDVLEAVGDKLDESGVLKVE